MTAIVIAASAFVAGWLAALRGRKLFHVALRWLKSEWTEANRSLLDEASRPVPKEVRS